AAELLKLSIEGVSATACKELLIMFNVSEESASPSKDWITFLETFWFTNGFRDSSCRDNGVILELVSVSGLLTNVSQVSMILTVSTTVSPISDCDKLILGKTLFPEIERIS